RSADRRQPGPDPGGNADDDGDPDRDLPGLPALLHSRDRDQRRGEIGAVTNEAGRPARFRVALTFGAEHPDRPHRPGVTEGLLDVLAERDVAATWFLQGRWVESAPALARRVAADGHLVGNHSFYHARLPLLLDEGLRTDIREAERVIREIVGVDPRPWFRC